MAENNQAVIDWWANYHHVEPTSLDSLIYQFDDIDAIRHMVRVASGLESMVLGEPQILGQLKTAYHLASRAQHLGQNGLCITIYFCDSQKSTS